MGKKYLKRIIAQSPEDLQFISACCSEAKVKIRDIKSVEELTAKYTLYHDFDEKGN